MAGSTAFTYLLPLAWLGAAAYHPPRKFVIVSNAMNGSIAYGLLPLSGSGSVTRLRSLIGAEDGLVHPQGLAVDQKRRLLLVADSGLRKIVSYGLTNMGDDLAVDQQTPVVEDIETRWVAADGLGNVFFSDEVGNRIMKVTTRAAEDGNTTGETLIAGVNVSAPGGIATDNYFVYWTNKVDGGNVGSVSRALQDGTQHVNGVPQGFTRLANSTPKSYGVCTAINQVFFTDQITTLWGVDKAGGTPVRISSNLSYPRGCAWDGSRVLVADRGVGAIFAFHAPMVSLAETTPTRVAEIEEAFGIGVYSGAARTSFMMPTLLCVAVAFLTSKLRSSNVC